ncbi:MAG: ABC transporter ATP-binding protein [Proteobacteria bacterium]|nr:ABC transporter ATP-binding protein [Pseudomonadota bacterium]
MTTHIGEGTEPVDTTTGTPHASAVPDSVSAAVDLSAHGRFHEAAAMLERLGIAVDTYASLYRAIGDYAESDKEAQVRLRAAFDRLADAYGAERVYSTVRPGDAEADLRRELIAGGTGRSLVFSNYLYLETLGEQRSRLALEQSLPEGTLVVHMLINFTSNVGDSMYLLLRASDGEGAHEEAVRFSNASVTLCELGRTRLYTSKTTTLCTFVFAPQTTELHVNGRLEVRQTLSERRPHLPRLALELVGRNEADLSAQVYALEVWKVPGVSLSPADARIDLFLHHARACVEALDTEALHEILASVESPDIPGLEDRFGPLLDKALGARPFNSQVLEGLLRRCDPALSQRWLDQNRDKVPTPVVRVADLSVQFSTAPHRVLALGRILRRVRVETFDVLRHIAFDVHQGDILGIIGENGAGKSTLLRCIAGLIPIKTGEIAVYGKHVLLRAGVGFRDEATGRENIYMAGSYLQLDPRQIEASVQEIIDFSELHEYIDRPFKYYSDGMKARLIFALATSITPDILMLDEPLGAGDARFRDKAARRMDDLIKRARAVIIVTHGVDFVRHHCTKALYLMKGRQAYYGDPHTAVAHYLNDLRLTEQRSDA